MAYLGLPPVVRKPTVERVEGGLQVRTHHEMGDPERVFYADRFEFIDVPLGTRILAIREDGLSGEADVAVEFVMHSDDFARFRESLREIEQHLQRGVPLDFSLPPLRGKPRIVESFKAMLGYVATSASGLSIDFLAYPAVQVHRVEQGVEPVPQLSLVMRVETLPGRLHGLLARQAAS